MSSPLIWPVCDDSSAKSTLATGPGIIQRRRPRPVRKSQSSKMMIMNGNSKRTTYQLVHKAGSRMWWSSSPQDESKAHSSGVRLEKDSRSCVWGVIMTRYGRAKQDSNGSRQALCPRQHSRGGICATRVRPMRWSALNVSGSREAYVCTPSVAGIHLGVPGNFP